MLIIFICSGHIWLELSFLLLLQYIVIPTRRSLAESAQILTSHALGDAISPYIIGQVKFVVLDNNNAFSYYSVLQLLVLE